MENRFELVKYDGGIITRSVPFQVAGIYTDDLYPLFDSEGIDEKGMFACYLAMRFSALGNIEHTMYNAPKTSVKLSDNYIGMYVVIVLKKG
jgi:hypothetical protein